MEYLRIGYAMARGLESFTPGDAGKLTHLNLAFGLIREGVLSLEMLPGLDCLQDIRRWNPALKIVLSVGGWGAGGFSTMAMTEEGRAAFTASCLAAVERYGLDGIDIDWEYPCSGVAGIDFDPRDRENFTRLLRELREALGDQRLLTVAVGAAESCVRDMEAAKVAAIVDYVQLMTYDLAGEFSGKAGHHAGLPISRVVVERYHAAGVPYGKMVLGAAFYGRHFAVTSAENNGLWQRAGFGEPGPTFGEITPEFLAGHGYREYWDEEGEAAYLFNGETFVSYESPEAIRRKCTYVKEKSLRGIMYWEHSCDPSRRLLDTIARELGET